MHAWGAWPLCRGRANLEAVGGRFARKPPLVTGYASTQPCIPLLLASKGSTCSVGGSLLYSRSGSSCRVGARRGIPQLLRLCVAAMKSSAALLALCAALHSWVARAQEGFIVPSPDVADFDSSLSIVQGEIAEFVWAANGTYGLEHDQ
jgi:hypothetical protein